MRQPAGAGGPAAPGFRSTNRPPPMQSRTDFRLLTEMASDRARKPASSSDVLRHTHAHVRRRLRALPDDSIPRPEVPAAQMRPLGGVRATLEARPCGVGGGERKRQKGGFRPLAVSFACFSPFYIFFLSLPPFSSCQFTSRSKLLTW